MCDLGQYFIISKFIKIPRKYSRKLRLLVVDKKVVQTLFSFEPLGKFDHRRCTLGVALIFEFKTDADLGNHLSRVITKPDFGVSDQVRYKRGCTTAEDG